MERASIKEPTCVKAASIKEPTSVNAASIKERTSGKFLSINEPTSVKRRSRSSHSMSNKGIPGGGSSLTIGDRVVVGQFRMLGYVRFVGHTQFSEGEWVGIELDEPYGKNNGSVQGQHYFDCKPNYGLFCRGISVAKCENSMVSETPFFPGENRPSATSSPRTNRSQSVQQADTHSARKEQDSTNATIQQQLGAPTFLPGETLSALEGDAGLLQLGEQLEQRIWEGLERRLEEMIQKAVASATRELLAEASKLQPSKESNKDEHCVVEGALHKASVIKCALLNAETDTDENNSAMHCIIKSALYTASNEICATTRCTFDEENLVPLAQQRIPPPIDTPYAEIAMQGEQKTMGIAQIIKQLNLAGLNTQQTPATYIPAQNILELDEENMRESETLSEVAAAAEGNGQPRTMIRIISTE